ncbi:MAG: dihydroneopterin aldolase [Bacteroidota bacterium]
MIIALEGMRFWANIGYYEEEQILGNEIHLDVYVNADSSCLVQSDDLGNTLNYETIYHICRMEIKKPVRLLETTAVHIHQRIHAQFQGKLLDVKVRISKISPPLKGPVERAYIEING